MECAPLLPPLDPPMLEPRRSVGGLERGCCVKLIIQIADHPYDASPAPALTAPTVVVRRTELVGVRTIQPTAVASVRAEL
jgi:hypothetical protein